MTCKIKLSSIPRFVSFIDSVWAFAAMMKNNGSLSSLYFLDIIYDKETFIEKLAFRSLRSYTSFTLADLQNLKQLFSLKSFISKHLFSDLFYFQKLKPLIFILFCENRNSCMLSKFYKHVYGKNLIILKSLLQTLPWAFSQILWNLTKT